MVSFSSIPNEGLKSLASNPIISKALKISGDALGGSPDSTGALHESFEIWSLNENIILNNDKNFAKYISRTGIWHIQIKQDNDAVGYAEASILGATNSDWEIDCVYNSSDLSHKIDAVSKWIDSNIKDDSLISRMIIMENYQIYAFWLLDPLDSSSDNQTIIIIDAPQEYGFFSIPLTYSKQTFINRLKQATEIGGII